MNTPYPASSPMTVDQAAKELGITPRAVRDLIRCYELKAYDASRNPNTGKARWRITRESIEQFIDKRSNRPTAPTPGRRAVRRAVPQHV